MPLISLGKVTVTAAGTPERVTKNLADPAAQNLAHSFLVEALPGNTGKIYIGLSGMNKTTGAGIIAILPVPTANFLPSFSGTISYAINGIELNEVYIDADVNGEGIIASCVQA